MGSFGKIRMFPAILVRQKSHLQKADMVLSSRNSGQWVIVRKVGKFISAVLSMG